MLTPDEIKAFDSKNAKSITEEQLTRLRAVTDDELKQLADAYPNVASGPFLLLSNNSSKPQGQLYPLSTFANLLKLRTKSGQKQYSIFNFRANLTPAVAIAGKGALPLGKVQDLTEEEKSQAQGLKKAEVQDLTGSGAEIEKEQEKELTGEGGEEQFPNLDDEAAAAAANEKPAAEEEKKKVKPGPKPKEENK
jgi:hypothetical protein